MHLDKTISKIPKKGSDIELYIDSLAFGGMGVSKYNDIIIFVKNAIPNQKVLARITKKRSSFLEARALEVLKESNSSIDVKCKHFNHCGGCTFQNLIYEEQLAAKESQVKDILNRIGGFKDINVNPILGCDEIFHYRNKMEFTFSNRRWKTDLKLDSTDSNFALGLHVPGRFDKILNIDECFLHSKTSNKILGIIKKISQELELEPYDIKNHSGFLRYLMIRHSTNLNEIMVNLVTSTNNHKKVKPIVDALVSEIPEIVSIVNNITSRKAGVSSGEEQILLYGKDTINERLGKFQFMISADSFFQTNTKQAEKLYEIIKEEAEIKKDDIIYDLFCGTGSISIYLANLAKKVYGFEISMSAVQDAIQNAHQNKIKNVRFFNGDLMNLLRKT